MTEESSITVSRTIDAPAKEIFDVLSNPDRHAELDGSGWVRSADHPQRIQAVGDVFRMNMEGEHMGGEYQTDNRVTGFQPGQLIAWQTAPVGTEWLGWEWLWELKPLDAGDTEVSLTYDWGKVTDKDLLSKITFPFVKKEQLEDSLAHLASAVAG